MDHQPFTNVRRGPGEKEAAVAKGRRLRIDRAAFARGVDDIMLLQPIAVVLCAMIDTARQRASRR